MSLLGWTLLVVNVIGYLWAWRFWIRSRQRDYFVYHDRFDTFNFIMVGLIPGMFIALAWPSILIVRGLYASCQHYLDADKGFWENIALKLVETRAERKQRKVLAK